MSELFGRTALVTGGGTGLGSAIARSLVHEGCRVVVVGRREAPLRALAAEHGDGVRAEVCDVSDAASVADLSERLRDEQVSIVINNAGVAGPVSPLVDVTPEDWDDVFAVNVRGTFLVCRAFLPGMIGRGAGDIINVASVSGKRPLAARTPYCASKMAVIGLTSTLAFEVGEHGISVNSLSPGPVESERMERNFRLEAERTGTDPDTARAAFAGRSALGRLVGPDEVARSVVAMLRMPGMTGADVDLSAGMVA